MAEAYIAEQPQCNQQQSKNRSLPKNNNEIPDDEISAATLPPPSSSNDAANNHRRAKSMAYSVQDPALLKEMDGNLIDSNLEPHYSNLIDSANAPIFGVDGEGRVNVWNKCAMRIVGYTPDEVMGKVSEDYLRFARVLCTLCLCIGRGFVCSVVELFLYITRMPWRGAGP